MKNCKGCVYEEDMKKIVVEGIVPWPKSRFCIYCEGLPRKSPYSDNYSPRKQEKKERMLVELEWDTKLGERWMNIDNLGLCLYSKEHTTEKLLKAKEKFLLSNTEILEIVAQGYCTDRNSKKTVDSDLLEDIAKAILKRLRGQK